MIETRIPPPVYALATAGLIWLADREFPVLRVIAVPWNRLGWPVIALGVGIDLYAVLFFTMRRTTVNPMRPQDTSELVVGGLNSVSRNPMYLGLVLSLSGWALLLGSPGGWLLVWIFARVLVIVQIAPEEAVLREKFGEHYVKYSRRVSRWFGRVSTR